MLQTGVITADAASPTSSDTNQQPAAASTNNQQPTADNQQPTSAQTPTPEATNYPPKTKADLQALAAQGDASAIHTVHSESVGMVGACPQPKRIALVDPSITGQQLAEDLLAYFYNSEQMENPCGAIVFVYHKQSETNDVYTAGRVVLDVTDSSGQINTDPNASNLTYKLTLDVGGDLSGQGYVVTYTA